MINWNWPYKKCSKQIDFALNEAGKIKIDLVNEKKTLNSFLGCISTYKNQDRIQDLIKDAKLSSYTISSLEEDYIKSQHNILKLQNDRIKALAKMFKIMFIFEENEL